MRRIGSSSVVSATPGIITSESMCIDAPIDFNNTADAVSADNNYGHYSSDHKIKKIKKIMKTEFKTLEHFRHVYDTITEIGNSVHDRTVIEFSISENNMILIDRLVKGKTPIGMISDSADGKVFRQFRRMKWKELTPELRNNYMTEFEEMDGCDETFKLLILHTALGKKNQYSEEQAARAEKKKR